MHQARAVLSADLTIPWCRRQCLSII